MSGRLCSKKKEGGGGEKKKIMGLTQRGKVTCKRGGQAMSEKFLESKKSLGLAGDQKIGSQGGGKKRGTYDRPEKQEIKFLHTV